MPYWVADMLMLGESCDRAAGVPPIIARPKSSTFAVPSVVIGVCRLSDRSGQCVFSCGNCCRRRQRCFRGMSPLGTPSECTGYIYFSRIRNEKRARLRGSSPPNCRIQRGLGDRPHFVASRVQYGRRPTNFHG